MNDKELRDWCYSNWKLIPEDARQRCVDYLDEKIPHDFIRECIREGEGNYFHFGAGMSVRNLLRDVISDSELPLIFYADVGESFQNWDDFYTGALDDLYERYK